MCGITGYVGRTACADGSLALLQRMSARLTHRGPDGQGEWCDPEAGIGLAHRRLAIVDLSSAGHQPMLSPSGRYVVVFNGEIYNHLELRDRLRLTGLAPGGWRGHSDTETLLAGIDQWGLEETLTQCVGMFAIALWDRRDRSLALTIDRLGEKPLYYGMQRGVLLFGSELKALHEHPAFEARLDPDVLAMYLHSGYVPAPHCIYRGMSKLLPGTLVRVDARTLATSAPKTYWSLRRVVEAGREHRFAGDDVQAVDELESHLATSVRLQQVADVPLGAFLSGGIDSSTVVALMQANSTRRVRTFSIGFTESGYDEARHASAVAAHLGTEHTELHLTPDEARSVIPGLPDIYDEPHADPSQIPTFLVSRLARRQVTVALSGDAGDEVFGGYNRYLAAPSIWRKLSLVPAGPRRLVGRFLSNRSPSTWNRVASALAILSPSLGTHVQPADKLRKLAAVISAKSELDLYRMVVTHETRGRPLVPWANPPPGLLDKPEELPTTSEFELSMMALDTVTYLPGDILVKLDRAAMAVSLEARVPFLDHRIVEFAWRLPLHMKIRNGTSKWILRQVLAKYVPAHLVERPKMGFGVPIDQWLRGPLRDWAESLLEPGRLAQEGLLDGTVVRRLWNDHVSGRRNWHSVLWDVLMFQAWLDRWGGRGRPQA
jgi:asparagine synthase (glutamine-hydrolysing)